MTERKGRIEEYSKYELAGEDFYMIEQNGNVECLNFKNIQEAFTYGAIFQGNAFYDRASAELAARKRAAQVKWERLCVKYGSKGTSEPPEAVDEMGEDMELLK